MHHIQTEHNIACDRLRLSGERAGEGGNVHISVPRHSTLNFDNNLIAEKGLRVDGVLSGPDGLPMITRDAATGETTIGGSAVSFDNGASVNLSGASVDFDGATVDFDNATVQNLQIDMSSLTITAADIQSSNIANSSLDAEIDALQLAVNGNTAARQNLPVNRVMISNGAGVLVPSTIDPQKILDNESNITQANANNISAINMIVANTALINTNTADISTNTGDISTLQTQQTTNTGDISTLQTQQTTNTGDISTLQSTTAGHTSDISTLQTQQTTNTANITSNTTATTNNAADVLLLQTLTTQQTADIGTLQTTTTQQTADIAANTAATAQNLNNIATNTQGITANTQDITTNTQAIATNSTAIATNGTAIATNSTAIAANGTAITALQTDVTAIEADYVATGSNAVLADVTTDELTTDGHTITQSTTAGLSNTTTYDIGTRSSSSTAGGITTTTAVNEKVKIHGDNLTPSDASLLISVHRTTTVTEVDGSGFTTVYPSTTETKRMVECNDTYLRSYGNFEMPNDKTEILFKREAAVSGQSPVYPADVIFRVGRNSSPNENNIIREGAKVYEPSMSAISNPHATDGTLWNNDLSASKGEYRVLTYNSLFSNFVIPKFKELLVNGGIHQVANFDGVSKSTDTFSTTFKNPITISAKQHDLSFHTGEGSMLANTTDNAFTVECESTFNKNITLGSGVDILDSTGSSVLTGGGGGGGGGGSLLSSNNVWTGTNEFSAGLSLSSAETMAQRTQTGGGFVFNNDLYQPAGVTGDGLFTRMSSAETDLGNQLVLISANTTDTAANTTELLQCVKLTGSQTITGQKTFSHGNTLFDSNINIQNNKELRIQNSAGDIAYLRYSLLKDLESPVEYITYGTTTSASAPKILYESGIETGAAFASTSHYAPLSLHAITHGTFLQIQLRGLLYLTSNYSGSSSNEVLFTLPSGYRPAKFHSYVVRTTSTASGETDDSTSLITIDSNGVCKYRSNSGSAAANTAPETFYDMAGVSFFTN